MTDLAVELAKAQKLADAERVIATIDDRRFRNAALKELGEVLAQAQQWTEAERVASIIIDNPYYRSSILNALGVALAQAQQWTEAERVISSIGNSSYRANPLCFLGAALFQANKLTQLLRLVQRSWLQADKWDYALAILSLANEFIPFKPEIGVEFFESFSWVDDFLKG